MSWQSNTCVAIPFSWTRNFIRNDTQYYFIMFYLQFVDENYKVWYHLPPNINLQVSSFFHRIPLLREWYWRTAVLNSCFTYSVGTYHWHFLLFRPLMVMYDHRPMPCLFYPLLTIRRLIVFVDFLAVPPGWYWLFTFVSMFDTVMWLLFQWVRTTFAATVLHCNASNSCLF